VKICPVCERALFRPVVSIASTAVSIGDLYPDRSSACSAPRGDIELAVCEGCGLVRNVAFDSSLILYDSQYENSQMFSPTFRAFAQELAKNLVSEYALDGKHVVEIGCGKGEFLELLCEAGVGSATGYDPSYAGEVDRCDGVRIERELYGSKRHSAADLLLSRHVFEHLEDPLAILRGLRQSLDGAATSLYLEVPDARFVLAGEGMWDVIYPHVNYFADLPMQVLLQRAGFVPRKLDSVFSGQFLAAHSSPGELLEGDPDSAALESWIRQVEAFGDRFRSLVGHWTEELAERAKLGPISLWGAGAKGVAFLNLTGASRHVEVAVDLNPRKHGRYLPGTGHAVVAPEELRKIRPTTVLVMNTLYEAEIRSSLGELGLDCETLCV